jgi:hypothetical protein
VGGDYAGAAGAEHCGAFYTKCCGEELAFPGRNCQAILRSEDPSSFRTSLSYIISRWQFKKLDVILTWFA